MSKLDQRGVIHLLVPLILLLGIIGGVYLITAGPLKLFPKASVSGPIGGVTYVDAKIGCGNPQGLTPDQICQQKGFVGAVAVDYQTAAKGYWWRQCGGASVSNCDRLNCKVNELDCTNTAGYWGSQQPYPENFTRAGTSSTVYKPADFDIQTCSGYSPGWTMRVACSLSGGIPGPITPTPSPTLVPSPSPSPSPTLVPSPSPSASPTQPPTSSYQRVFVTNNQFNGNLGGLSGADTKCQQKAESASLGGTWKAWLSDTRTSASSRLNHSQLPYVLLDGTRVADNWADLTDGSLQHDINLTELRTLANDRGVWTATNTDGLADRTPPRTDPNTCGEWSDGTDNSSGDGGNTTMRTPSIYGPGPTWTTRYGGQCNVTHSLYCFEQSTAGVVTVQPSTVVSNGTITVTWNGILNPHLEDYMNMMELDNTSTVNHSFWIHNNCSWSTPSTGTPQASGSCTIALARESVRLGATYHMVLSNNASPRTPPIVSNDFTVISPPSSPTPVACTVNDLRVAFFSRRGDPKYNPACDINNDGRISVTDYSALLRNLRR